MKIILICESVFPETKGGQERWMVWLAVRLSSRGHDVFYLNNCRIQEKRDGVQYVSVINQKWNEKVIIKKHRRSIYQSLKFSIAIRPFIKKIEPDVIYCSQAIFSIFSVWFSRQRNWLTVIEWLELWPIKHWCANEGLILGTLGYVSQRMATKCGDVRVVVAQRFLKQLGKNKKNNILLPGLYMQKPNNIYPSFKIRNDVLFLARYVPHKQPLLALGVIFQLQKLGWQGIFHIIGTGTLIHSMRKEILVRKMTEYVNLIENASENEVEFCFEKSFALIHPSKQEGYGLVVIEAAVRGIPTILIDYPCNASLDLGISPDYFSNTDDPIALAILIFQAFDNQEKNYNRLKNWTDEVLPKLNADKSVDTLVSIFEKNMAACKIPPKLAN